MTIKERLLKNRMVEEISDERPNDGIWVYLKPTYINVMTETHIVHEDTWTEVMKSMKRDVKNVAVRKCQKLHDKYLLF